MRIVEAKNRDQKLTGQLLNVWENSVKATHLFLSEEERNRIKEYVPEALENVPILVIAENDAGNPVRFMGIADQKLEMLFISNENRGNGVGKKLLQYGADRYSVNTLAVNEQNPQARGVYEHMGFKVYKRSELDEQGKPYPVLYMKRDG